MKRRTRFYTYTNNSSDSAGGTVIPFHVRVNTHVRDGTVYESNYFDIISPTPYPSGRTENTTAYTARLRPERMRRYYIFAYTGATAGWGDGRWRFVYNNERGKRYVRNNKNVHNNILYI